MSAPAWMKFYPSDWQADMNVKLCSLAARGLWIEMLFFMHQSEPRGSLLMNGQQMTPKQIALLIGTSPKDVERLINELEENGVFSRAEDGTIYSRRMRQEDEKATRDRENGLRGGNPDLLKNKPLPSGPDGDGGLSPPDNGPDKARARAAQSPGLRTQKEGSSFVEGASNTRVEAHSRASARGRSPGKKTRINLPEDWRPSDEQVAYALSVGWQRSDFPLQVARFIHTSNKNGGCIDADAAWKTFCTSDWAPQNRRVKSNSASYRENGRLALIVDQVRSEGNVERRHSCGSGDSTVDQDASDGVSDRSNVFALGARTGTWPGDV